MQGLRIANASGVCPAAPCERCRSTGCPWDRIGEVALCPDCQELLAAGEGEPLVQPLAARSCAVCDRDGVVRYLTFPLHARDPIELDLCPAHFHAYLARRLDRYAFRVLARKLKAAGLDVQHIFLLHEAFYDQRGHPIQPVADL
jgi:hypothetical protein